MTAVAAWFRVDARRRAKSLVVLALLVALATGTVLAAAAGARRGSETVDRLLERTEPATLAVLPNQPGFNWDAIAAIPGVAAVARFPVSAFTVEGLPPDEGADFVYADASIMRTIERPVLLAGRLADPDREDETVITKAFAKNYGKGLGDTVTFRLYTPEQVDERQLGGAMEAEGPRIKARIVGVVRSPWFSDSGDTSKGRLVPSPALFNNHEANLLGTQDDVSINALVRLDRGAAGVPDFRAQLAKVSGRTDIEFFDLAAMAKHADDVADFEANSLLAFALAAAIAALFLVGQAVARYVAGATADLEILRAFGMTPGEVRTGAVLGPGLAAVLGAFVGVAGAYLVSSRFPIGSVGPLEPAPGREVDTLVLGVGLVAVPVLVIAGSLLTARRSSRKVDARGSALAALAARWGAPVPVSVGTRFALERGGGSQSVPVRPALLGAAVGVLGVVAALTFADGVHDSATNPARFGQVFQIETFFGFNDEDFAPTDDLKEILAADPDVVAVNDTRQAVASAGSVDLAVFSFDPVDEPMAIVFTDGRLPRTPDEIALAPATAKKAKVGVGDTVELEGTRSTGTYRVSGIAFVPANSHNDYDEGAWALRETYDDLFDGFKFHTTDIVIRPGADPEAVAARLGQSVADFMDDPSIAGQVAMVRPPPSRLAELEQVRRLPLYLAVFLALLAIGAVGHALATAVRRRRHDIAVLRAIGITRRQCRSIVVMQASVLAAFGLVVGVPFGLALGRNLWSTVATNTPVAYVSPFALWLLVLIGPAALVIANILAAWPSHRAATTRVSHVLRAG